jgi:hypothetical protein
MEVNSGLWREEMPSLRKMRPISNTRSKPPTCRQTQQTQQEHSGKGGQVGAKEGSGKQAQGRTVASRRKEG